MCISFLRNFVVLPRKAVNIFDIYRFCNCHQLLLQVNYSRIVYCLRQPVTNFARIFHFKQQQPQKKDFIFIFLFSCRKKPRIKYGNFNWKSLAECFVRLSTIASTRPRVASVLLRPGRPPLDWLCYAAFCNARSGTPAVFIEMDAFLFFFCSRRAFYEMWDFITRTAN